MLVSRFWRVAMCITRQSCDHSYEEVIRLAETRLAQNSLHYLNRA